MFFSHLSSGKMPSSIKTNIKSASSSMHPYNRWVPPALSFSSDIGHVSQTRRQPFPTLVTRTGTCTRDFHGNDQLLWSFCCALPVSLNDLMTVFGSVWALVFEPQDGTISSFMGLLTACILNSFSIKHVWMTKLDFGIDVFKEVFKSFTL